MASSNTRLTVRRAAKISTAQYENTTVEIELSEDWNEAMGFTESQALESLISRCDAALKRKIDEIELGKIQSKSRASRFGV